ncbi:MAG: hypothetical protein ACFE8U_15285 [Candidatus Hermodarchaeota archaeon]
MSSKVLNPAQLKNSLLTHIEDYRKRVKNQDITLKETKELIENLLFEREIIIEEFQAYKEAQTRLIPQIYRSENDLNILVSEIDETLYNDFISLSHKIQLSPGEVLSSCMKDLITSFDGTSFPLFSADNLEKLILRRKFDIKISHQENLIISQKDLVEMGVKVNFDHIRTLEFSDVDLDTFITFVGSIDHCNLVSVPKSIPKLILWSKCHNCSHFQFLDPNKDKPILQYAKEANQVVENWKNNGT